MFSCLFVSFRYAMPYAIFIAAAAIFYFLILLRFHTLISFFADTDITPLFSLMLSLSLMSSSPCHAASFSPASLFDARSYHCCDAISMLRHCLLSAVFRHFLSLSGLMILPSSASSPATPFSFRRFADGQIPLPPQMPPRLLMPSPLLSCIRLIFRCLFDAYMATPFLLLIFSVSLPLLLPRCYCRHYVA